MVRLSVTLTVAWVVTLYTSPRAGADVVVDAGYDLFATVASGTSFDGVPFMGVPLGTFNFGGAIGTKGVGTADTIIQRLSNVDATTSGSTNLVMQALQLETVAPTSLPGIDPTVGTYYITLQSARGGTASTGTMTINATATNPTTFSSSIDVFFDIRSGSLTGPIVYSSDLVLSNTSSPWSQIPPPAAMLITGVNSLLNGVDHTNDFYASPVETHPTGAQHSVVPAAVPEPSVIATGSLSLLLWGAMAWRSRKRSAC